MSRLVPKPTVDEHDKKRTMLDDDKQDIVDPEEEDGKRPARQDEEEKSEHEEGDEDDDDLPIHLVLGTPDEYVVPAPPGFYTFLPTHTHTCPCVFR